MRKCPNCGASCEDDVKFCADCGAVLAPAPAAADKARQAVPQDDYDEVDLEDLEYDEEEYGGKKKVSVIAVIALICAIAGCFSSGYGMVIVFGNLIAGLAFLLPGIIGILFGFIGFKTTGKGKPKKGRVISVIAVILGIAGIAFWLVIVLIVRHMAVEAYGTGDMISILRTIFTFL